MPSPVLHPTKSSPASTNARRDVPRSNESELPQFDLRASLADMSVRETSFGEFLAELRKTGVKPN